MLVQIFRFLSIAVLASSLGAIAWGQAQKNWKDRAEYDLYESITKATDPNKKLALLKDWSQKYESSDYSDIRLQLLLATYQQLGQANEVMSTAKQILEKDPKNLQARSAVAFFIFRLTAPTPEQLSLTEQAAKGLLNDVGEKPANISDADWQKSKGELEVLANNALGYVHMQRKENEQAEEYFRKSLRMNPNNAQVSYWLGTIMVAQRKPEKQVNAIYHFARAASYDGPGALNPEGRKQVQAYLKKAYNLHHGSEEGLDQVIATAKQQALPPEGFEIKTAAQVAFEKDEELKRNNPQLALWLGIKQNLTAEGGEAYFAEKLKNAAVPALKGKVISQTPANRPKEIVVGIENAQTPEITLKLDQPMATSAEPGTEIEFEGLPAEFSKEPFNLTFNVEKDKVSGWPAPAPPARRTKKK